MALADLFPDTTTFPPTGYGIVQLIVMMVFYAIVLVRGARMVADGAELLQLVLNPALVGALVLPTLGALPDAAIVLFSGLGPDAQNQLDVGVGTLAGSSIMLLTLAWSAAAAAARVDIVRGEAVGYDATKRASRRTRRCCDTGVALPVSLAWTGAGMLATATPLVIVQVGVWSGAATAPCALAALICALVCLVAYCGMQLWLASAADAKAAAATTALHRQLAAGAISLATALHMERGVTGGGDVTSHMLHAAFQALDVNADGGIDYKEWRAALRRLGLTKLNDAEVRSLFKKTGGEDAHVDFKEFEAFVRAHSEDALAAQPSNTNVLAAAAGLMVSGVTASQGRAGHAHHRTLPPALVAAAAPAASAAGGTLAAESATPTASSALVREARDELADDNAESEDEEEDLAAGMTPLQVRIKAALLLFGGLALITLFSDPMVDALAELAKRASIPPFYISFIVTPVISNASEVIAAVQFAGRRTRASTELTFASLLGAATMNNTLCTAVFLGLVYIRGLNWKYSAEVTAILMVEAGVAAFTLWRVPRFPIFACALLLYPASLTLVALLEAYARWQ